MFVAFGEFECFDTSFNGTVRPRYNRSLAPKLKQLTIVHPQERYMCGPVSLLIKTDWRKCESLTYVIIGSDNGLRPSRHQAIIWISAGILLNGPLGTNFSEVLIELYTVSFKRVHLKCPMENGGHFVSGSMS